MNSPVKIWRNQKKIKSLLGKMGFIESYTLIYSAPKGFENHVPYPIVLVKMDGKKTIGQLVDWDKEELQAGQKVKAVLRKAREDGKEGVIAYCVKFQPI